MRAAPKHPVEPESRSPRPLPAPVLLSLPRLSTAAAPSPARLGHPGHPAGPRPPLQGPGQPEPLRGVGGGVTGGKREGAWEGADGRGGGVYAQEGVHAAVSHYA